MKDKTGKKHGTFKGKLPKVIAGIVAIFVVIQIPALGYFGIGPLGFIYNIRMRNLPGNKPEYDFSKIVPMANSPLSGGTIAILGSSVARGEASEGYAVGEYLASRFECSLTKEAVSGTTLAAGKKNSYVDRIHNLDPEANFDLFVCQLSTNDASMHIPLGGISQSRNLEDFDTSTVTGALEYIICYAQETWSCQMVFFTESRYDSEEYRAMVDQLLKLKDKWGIGVLDLWSSDTFNDISDEQRDVYMYDDIHPTKAGYRDWWGPEQERQLLAFLGQYCLDPNQ